MPRDEQRLLTRSGLLTALFGIWFLLTVVQALRIGWLERARFLREGERSARFEGVTPARRGRILDRNGVPLAWSENYFDLERALPEGEDFSGWERAELGRILSGGFDLRAQRIRAGLRASEVLALDAAIASGLRARIVPRRERILVGSPALRRKLEAFEKHFDRELSGSDGRYRVLLDHYRNWIPSSWELLRAPVPGRDVRLQESLNRLEEPR